MWGLLEPFKELNPGQEWAEQDFGVTETGQLQGEAGPAMPRGPFSRLLPAGWDPIPAHSPFPPAPHPLPFPGVSPLHQSPCTLLGRCWCVWGAATASFQLAHASSRCPESHGFSSSLAGGRGLSPGSGRSRGCLCRWKV